MTALEAQVLDIGRARLGDPEAVEAEKDRQGGMSVVVALGGKQERAQLAAVEAPGLARVDLGTTDVLGRVGRDHPVDVGESVEAKDRREPPVDCRGG